MHLFTPTLDYRRITEIPVSVLKQHQISGLILDVDNTLTTHDNPVPLENLDMWLEQMTQEGIKLIIVSNNDSQRVEPFARQLHLDFISEGKKPLSDGFCRAANVMQLPKERIAVVGDQLFTDILGGNLWGCLTILVQPIEMENTRFFRLKRKMEKPILRHYHKRKVI